MKNVEHLASVTLAGLAGVFNDAVANHSLPIDPVKKFASKEAATARISRLAEEYGLDLIVINDGEVALVQGGEELFSPVGDEEPVEDEVVDPTEDAEEPGEEPGEDEDAEESVASEDEEAPFVKATKEELAAMDGPTRAAYRKARRAAARRARKARQS